MVLEVSLCLRCEPEICFEADQVIRRGGVALHAAQFMFSGCQEQGFRMDGAKLFDVHGAIGDAADWVAELNGGARCGGVIQQGFIQCKTGETKPLKRQRCRYFLISSDEAQFGYDGGARGADIEAQSAKIDLRLG